MKLDKIQYILLAMVAALLLSSCQAPDGFEIKNPNHIDGLTLRANFGVVDFGSNTTTLTRSGYAIATPREIDIDNAYVFVFSVEPDNPNAAVTLLEASPIIPDANSLDQETSYFVLTERNENVKLYFFANIPKSAIDQFIEGGGYNPAVGLIGPPMQPYPFSEFVKVTIPYSLDNHVLKTTITDGGLESDLPMYIEPILLTSVSQASLDAVPQPIPAVFAYARIDMFLNDGSSTTSLKEISVTKAPILPPSPSASSTQQFLEQSHTVTPITNESPFPAGVTAENQSTKYIGGLYMYPTSPLRYYSTTFSTDSDVKTSVVVKINRAGDGENSGDRYYNILINYTPEGSTGVSYGINNGTRYLIRLNSLNSPGYLTEAEAVVAPPSNVDYDIIIDDSVIDFSSNGQYYLGIEKDNYSALIVSAQSNMLNVTVDRSDFFWERDNPSWYIIDDSFVEVDIDFSYGLGEGLAEADVNIEKRIELPEGITVSNANGWTDSYGNHSVTLKIARSFNGGEVKIVVGELSKTIYIDFQDIVTTDYTDISFVNRLTGLSGDGRGNTEALRVSNSYILSPNDDFATEFYIPINDRIEEFWSADYGNNATHLGLSTIDWREDDNYTVQVLWSDGNPNGITVEKSYSPSSNVSSPQNAIRVHLNSGVSGQNILVAVKQSDTVIWSWHLWITNYNPYITPSGVVSPTIGTIGGVASVVGGSIFRYAGGRLWADGDPYSTSAIMDRNIGATSTLPELNINSGSVLFYQFGRKDPFPWSNSLWSPASSAGTVSFATSVYNPTTYYQSSGGNWSNQNSEITISWNDKNTAVDSNIKSLFDPSPLGWMLPHKDVWQNFSSTYLSWSSSGDNHGLTYNRGDVSAYHPITRHITYFSGLFNASQEALNWSTTPATTTVGTAMVSSGSVSSVVSTTEYLRASGYPVRSVREL